MATTRTCGSCAADNPADAQFCMACGARLERSCPECGERVLPEARFCVACGAVIEREVGQTETVRTADGAGARTTRELDNLARAAGREATTEERRTVTVLFADLSGYTAIA